MNTKVTRNFTYGLFVITAKEGDKLNGCIINTGIQAGSDPLTVAVSLNKADYTHDMIMNTGKFKRIPSSPHSSTSASRAEET